jgi:hypothetical protein
VQLIAGQIDYWFLTGTGKQLARLETNQAVSSENVSL